MSNPWTVEKDAIALLNEGGCAEVREGPTPLYDNRTAFLTYSSCDTSKPDCQPWSIALPEGAGPLSPEDKEQLPCLLLSRNHANTPEYTCSFRSTRAQRIGWNADGTSDLGEPLPVGASQLLPSGDPGPGSRVINDIDTGESGLRVSYEGDWTRGSQRGVTCFNSNDHYSIQADPWVPNIGYATFPVDNGPPSDPVSYYNKLQVREQRTYLSHELEPSEHTLTVTVTGDKPENASNPYVTIDRAEVYTLPVALSGCLALSLAAALVG